jgi:hypothetical protein
MKMNEFQKEVVHLATVITYTLAFILLCMTTTLLGGLFMPNSVIDNKDIFPIIAPAYSTVIVGFIGWLAAIKINNVMEKTENDTTE